MSTTEATTPDTGIIPGTVAVAHLHTGDSITGSFAASLDDLYRHDERGFILFPPIRNESGADIAAGRRQVTEAFLRHSRAEWLFMVDDDMGFAPDIVEKLLAAADPETAPVMGGLCFSYKRYEVTSEKSQRYVVRPTIYKLIETSNDIGYAASAEWERDAITQVDGTGAACLLIHRSVLQGMTDLNDTEGWAGRLFEGESPWWEPVVIPKGRLAGATRLSEDLSFCFRCKVAGVPIFVNTAAKTSHKKPVYLDEWYHDNQPLREVEPSIVIVGTGRSGTNFIADALSLAGVSCGHEAWWNTFGTRGPALVADSSWPAANYLDDYDGVVWHQVRHPLKVINSLLVELDMEDAPDYLLPYEAERRRWAGYDPADDTVVKAMRVVAHWLQVCEKHAERTWRVEDVTPGFLLELVDAAGVEIPLRYARTIIDQLGTETNKHPEPERSLVWADLPDGDDKTYIESMAAQFGYDLDAA